MPTKMITLESPLDGKGSPYSYGGAEQEITALNPSGDGYVIDANGGNDSIVVIDLAGAPGSDDTLIGGKGSDYIVGGLGDDEIFGGNQDGSDGGKGQTDALNTLFGDMQGNFANFTGGGDRIRGGDDTTNVMYGDVLSASSSYTFVGGDDLLIGGDDAVSVLIGGTNFTTGNLMVGDAYRSNDMLSNPEGGDDTLVSGQNSDDVMIGDFGPGVTATGVVDGADIFVFGLNNGSDIIWDFDSADVINLFDTGLTSFADLAGFISDDGTDTMIDLGGATGVDGTHTVLVMGVTDMNADSFEFTDWMA